MEELKKTLTNLSEKIKNISIPKEYVPPPPKPEDPFKSVFNPEKIETILL